jgi:UDPglucose 6-dehydrogenase
VASTTDRPRARRPRISVLGLGYLGTVHAACLAESGFEVVGVDTDAARVRELRHGAAPIWEPGLQALLRRGLASGRLRFSRSYARAAELADVHFICVGTPQLPGRPEADLSQLVGCVERLAPLLTRPCLVVGKSTGPVGTADRLERRLTDLAPAGPAAELAWNPEFLREGHAVADTMRPDRIVAGVRSDRAERLLRLVYAGPLARGTPFVVTSLPTAELVKTAANAFLATKVSFINAMAEICQAAGADVLTLAKALGHDPRIGAGALHPGLGFGGGCLPKDLRAFLARGTELGQERALSFLGHIDEINMRCRARTVELARELAGGSFDERVVGVLGAAFKPGSDDTRDSPALDVAATVHRLGAKVTVYDPAAMDRARHEHPELEYAASAVAAATDCDVLMVLTEWQEFRDADPEILGKAAARRNVVDGRHALDPSRWRAAGWRYRALGRPGCLARPQPRAGTPADRTAARGPRARAAATTSGTVMRSSRGSGRSPCASPGLAPAPFHSATC